VFVVVVVVVVYYCIPLTRRTMPIVLTFHSSLYSNYDELQLKKNANTSNNNVSIFVKDYISNFQLKANYDNNIDPTDTKLIITYIPPTNLLT